MIKIKARAYEASLESLLDLTMTYISRFKPGLLATFVVQIAFSLARLLRTENHICPLKQ
jgi:hypothetical protein